MTVTNGRTGFASRDYAPTNQRPSPPQVIARAGTNITLACPGVTPKTYIFLVEWKCSGCECRNCPNPDGTGYRILRYISINCLSWGPFALDRVFTDHVILDRIF